MSIFTLFNVGKWCSQNMSRSFKVNVAKSKRIQNVFFLRYNRVCFNSKCFSSKKNILELLITPSLHSWDLSVNIIHDNHSVPALILSLDVKNCPAINLGHFYRIKLHYTFIFFSTTTPQRLGRFSHFIITHLNVWDIGGYQTAHSFASYIVNYCEDLR